MHFRCAHSRACSMNWVFSRWHVCWMWCVRCMFHAKTNTRFRASIQSLACAHRHAWAVVLARGCKYMRILHILFFTCITANGLKTYNHVHKETAPYKVCCHQNSACSTINYAWVLFLQGSLHGIHSWALTRSCTDKNAGKTLGIRTNVVEERAKEAQSLIRVEERHHFDHIVHGHVTYTLLLTSKRSKCHDYTYTDAHTHTWIARKPLVSTNISHAFFSVYQIQLHNACCPSQWSAHFRERLCITHRISNAMYSSHTLAVMCS